LSSLPLHLVSTQHLPSPRKHVRALGRILASRTRLPKLSMRAYLAAFTSEPAAYAQILSAEPSLIMCRDTRCARAATTETVRETRLKGRATDIWIRGSSVRREGKGHFERGLTPFVLFV